MDINPENGLTQISVTRSGLYSNPRKVIPSEIHNAMFIMGDHSVYSKSLSDGKVTMIQGSTSCTFSGIDVSDRGEVLLVMKSILTGEYLLKILAKDLFKVKAKIPIKGSAFVKCLFTSPGNAIAVSDDRNKDPYQGQYQHYFNRINFDKDLSLTEEHIRVGLFVGVNYDKLVDKLICVTSEGKIWEIKGDLSEEDFGLYNLRRGDLSYTGETYTKVSSTSNILNVVTKSEAIQEKVRIFVGSSPWTNDMWDSGEVSTSLTEMEYGGGDNLEKGQKYWVHIMTYHPVIAGHYSEQYAPRPQLEWSRPQMKEFVVPR